MENNELYPKGTVQQTDEFALRQKIKKFVGENVEEIIKEETVSAFKKLGYEESDGYLFVIAAGGKDNKEREVGKNTAEGKMIVTVSAPKMLNMGATKPVSYMQKVTTFGGKKIVSEIYLEIIGETVHVEYKNTEAAAFHQSSEKNTYAPNRLNKSGTIAGLGNEASFKKEFKSFFKPIAEAEVEYLIGTKIGNDDKSEKNMNDSIIKENKHSMKLTDIITSSFEDAANKIDDIVKEAFTIKKEAKTSDTLNEEPVGKELVDGNEDESKTEESLEEITSTGAAGSGAGAYLTPHAFSNDGKTKEFKANKSLGYTEVPMNEAVKNTNYGINNTPRAHLVREYDGRYTIQTENAKPYTENVEMEPGYLNVPKGMEKTGDNPESGYVMGMHGKANVNSKEELTHTGHGDLNKLEEGYQRKLDLTKRKFSSLKENEEKGINKRYIITEKLTKDEEKKRWKTLFENDCFCNVKDKKDTISMDSYETQSNKEFEANNKPLESDLCNTQFSGEENGFLDIPKAKGSMIVFRLSESDVKKNKMYLVDHFTKKLVYNPLYKSQD